MAVKKKKVVEEVQEVEIQDEGYVFEMLCGYTDEEGVKHTEFELREITGKDEEEIAKPDVKDNLSKVINVLLSRCVRRIGSLTPKGVGGVEKWRKIIKDLYVGDQDYMITQLRRISVGDDEDLQVKHVCPSCNTKLDTSFSIEELPIKEFKGQEVLDFELQKGYTDSKGVHKEGTMRLPKGFDRELILPLLKNNKAKGDTLMLTRLCKFKDGTPVTEDVMRSLVLKDRTILRELLYDNLFGVDPSIDVICSNCGTGFKGSFNAVNFI